MARRTATQLGVAALVALVACAPAPQQDVGVAAHAIVDGELTEGDDAVVGMVAQDQLYCSGTLVAPHIVLTAAHCLPPDIPVEPSEVQIFAGQSWADGGWVIDSLDLWVHPEHLTGALWKDIGLVALNDAPAAPIPIRDEFPQEGEAMRILGFGRIEADDASDDRKRTGTATVASVVMDGMILSADPSASCGGDSGGPALVDVGGEEMIAGVHSRGTCELDMTEMRAELHIADVEAFIEAHPPPTCAEDGRCAFGCPDTDVDCPVTPQDEEEASGEPSSCAAQPGGRPDGTAWALSLLLVLRLRKRLCCGVHDG